MTLSIHDPTEWFGEPHTLIVLEVTPPEGQFDDGTMDYEIEHPSSCKQEDRGAGLEYVCDIAYSEDNVGLPFALRYSGTPIVAPGTYQIQGWGNKTYVPWCGYEYDCGVGVMSESERAATITVSRDESAGSGGG